MISVVLYGRNDNYGYNLHKRAALSFNCIAEVLTDPSDEILFVDYNTPDDFPTFPEAIQDTLTDRARDLLRIFRVRPRIHDRFKFRTRLMALEPVARNVAVRRSNQSNRWILSTNTDMIFVTQRRNSLTEIARDLPAGFYHAPRIESPEALWESFDRKAPAGIIETVRQWGSTLHLNEIVLGSNVIRYDAPGDFQLLLRSDLFGNFGFNEEMLLGWHVDSNIAKRMSLIYEEVGDLGNEVYGYHCDHTRQITPMHGHDRTQNDLQRFVDNVTRPDVPEQSETWGCANDSIEEVRLVSEPARLYIEALSEAVGKPLTSPIIVEYTARTYNKSDYDASHLMPFLADMFVSMPRNSNVAWYGARTETLRLFAILWSKLNYTGKILVDHPAKSSTERLVSTVRSVSTATALAEADAFIVDFGGLPADINKADALNEIDRELQRSFIRVVREERHRLMLGLAPRRVIAINAINNTYESFVSRFVGVAATPYATHMRHGFVLPPGPSERDDLSVLSIGELGNWLPYLHLGAHSRADKSGVTAHRGPPGFVVYGPYWPLPPGQYEMVAQIWRPVINLLSVSRTFTIRADVVTEEGKRVLAAANWKLSKFFGFRSSAEFRLSFEVAANLPAKARRIETRLWTPGDADFRLKSLIVRSKAA